MKIYIPKSDLKSFIIFPVPDDVENYYSIETDTVPTLTQYHSFDPETESFVQVLPGQDEIIRIKNEQIEIQRREQYIKRCDPLTMEATLKQNIGLQDEAGALFQQAYNERLKIQCEFPYV
jgi:hypothetical protein